jgi:hypothetical protein
MVDGVMGDRDADQAVAGRRTVARGVVEYVDAVGIDESE